MQSQIIGSGFVTGENLVTNDQLAQVMDTSDAWIRERSGVETRYYVEQGTTTSDLGVGAAKKALEDAGIAKEEIDYIVFATMTPDYYFPGCGGIMQDKLGLSHVPALDIRQQCTGFIYGLQISDALLKAGQARTVLLVRGGEPPTDEEKAVYTSFRDRTVLFGDAGGAVVLRQGEGDTGLLGFQVHSDGANFKDLYVPGAGFARRPYVNEVDVREWRHVPEMNGRAVFKLAVARMPEVVRELCKNQGVSIAEIDLLIAHQANLRINEVVQRALGLSNERVYNNIQRYGNTTAATIPIALDECRKSGRIQPGHLVCFVGLGSGFHWGAALMRA